MQGKESVLNKYQLKHKHGISTFTIVPREVINANISCEAKGVYCLLAVNASSSSKYNGLFALNMQTIENLSVAIGLSHQNQYRHKQYVQQQLESLVNAGFIKIVQYGDLIDIVFPELKKSTGKGFAKLYPESVSRILKNSTGKAMLKKLYVYAGLRTLVFENSNSNRILEQSNNYIAKVLNVSVSTLVRQLEWFRNKRVLAYFKCRLNHEISKEKYYYADMNDADILTEIVKGYQHQGVVRYVIE